MLLQKTTEKSNTVTLHMTSTRSFTQNQVVRFSRVALNSGYQSRTFSTEPVSKFKTHVENTAFKEQKTRRSILYRLHGEKFPYLQSLMTAIDFGFATPAFAAAVYVTARTRKSDWQTICARDNAANVTIDTATVQRINDYFQKADEPQADELHEIHSMFETFMRPSTDDLEAFGKAYQGKKFCTMAFLSATSNFDRTAISDSFRQYESHMSAKREIANDSTWELIFRTFQQDTSWFSKQ